MKKKKIVIVTIIVIGVLVLSFFIGAGFRCSLRPLAVANAFFNGRYAEQNGRSYLVDC